MSTSVSSIPVYDTDLFSAAVLSEPFEHYRAMRDLGPLVRLRDPDVYVLSRFDNVRDALQAPDALASGGGVGFNDLINKPGAPNIIMSDGGEHRRLRAEVVRPILPAPLKQHRAVLKALIGERIASLVDRGSFDAMTEIAPFLPLEAISKLVGLPEDGRASMLEWAAAVFNAIGPWREGSEGDFKIAAGARAYIANVEWTSMREGGWARNLYNAVTAGKLSEPEARGAMSAYILPSLDTTILAMGHLLYLLGRDPEAWSRLKADPSLIESTVLESVRHSSVIRWFSRVARTDYPVGDDVIPAGARVMVIYASANRDERHFPDPDRFDIGRDARTHLAWGSGPHMCVGMHLAKMEMEVMLEALIEHCETLEVDAPEPLGNRGLYGFKSLAIELRSRT